MTPPPILALHGFAGAGADFSGLADACTERRWLAPDLPGHDPAGSPGSLGSWPAAPLEETAGAAAAGRWAVALADAHGTARPVLLGYSMGGRLALHAAILRPEAWRAVVLVGASAGIAAAAERRERRIRDEVWAQRLETDGMRAFLEAWEAQAILQPTTPFPAAWEGARRLRRMSLAPAGLAGAMRTFGQGSLPCLLDDLPHLDLPVHLFAGEHDARCIAHARAMLERLPDATLDMIGGAGHAALFERPEDFSKHLQRRI